MKSTNALSLPAVAILFTLGCVTAGRGALGISAGPMGERAWYDPKVVLTSFGEPNFEHDAAVVQAYLDHLATARSDNFRAGNCDQSAPPAPARQTARERLEDRRPAAAPVKRECPPPKPVTPPEVQVLVDALPEGLDVVDGRVRISEGAGYALLGRVQFTSVNAFSLGLPKAVVVTELKYLAQAAGANLLLMSFVNETTTSAGGAVALLLRADRPLDPAKRKMGKVPTEI